MDRETAMAIVSRCSTTPFLVKLWAMLDDPDNAPAIEWDATGDNFAVKDPSRMSRDVLPKHFRHNNFSSFQRQLNYFGFKKTGKGKGRGCTYTHEDFCLHRPHDVLRIRRKTNTGGAKGHHTNKTGQLLNLEISPLNTACPAGAAINGRRPTMAAHLKVAVPARHRHGTRRAVRIKKEELGGPAAGQKRARADDASSHLFGAPHESMLSGFSGPVTPATPVSATELPTHAGGALGMPGAPKRPRLIETAASNAARGVAGAGAGAGAAHAHAHNHNHHGLDSALAFDMDPCLSPLSPLRLTDPALRGPVGTASDMQVIFDGLGSEPFSPLLTPRGSSMLSGVLQTPKTPRDAANFAQSALASSPPRAAQQQPAEATAAAATAAPAAEADAEAAAPAAAQEEEQEQQEQQQQQQQQQQAEEDQTQQPTADADTAKPVQHVAAGFCEALSPLLPPAENSVGSFVLSA